MKTLWNKRPIRIIVLILLYIIILAAGCELFCFVPFRSDLTTMAEKAAAMSETIAAGKTDYDDYMYGSVRSIVFDASGTLVCGIYPGKYMPASEFTDKDSALIAVVTKDLNKVLNGHSFETFLPTNVNGELSFHQVVAVPVTVNNHIDGALFMYKKNGNIIRLLVIFAAACTVCYGMFILVILMARKQKEREKHLAFVKGRYIANVTHELKTPVTNIRVLADALYDDSITDPVKQKHYIYRILLESKRQEHLIQGILRLSKLQSHSIEFDKRNVSVQECFSSTFEKYSDLADCLETELHIDESIAALPDLYTDTESMASVMDTLLDNAFKFTEHGSIRICGNVSGNKVIFSIKDTGIGIAKDDLPLIFERFYKNKSVKNEKGSGLGLAIVKETLDQLEEKVWAESTLGEGSTFYFTVEHV